MTRRRRRILHGWRLTALVAAVVVVVAGAVAIPRVVSAASTAAGLRSEVLPAPVHGTTTVDVAARRVPNTTGVPGVLAWDTQGWPGNASHPAGSVEHVHVTGPVRYAVIPPIGGPHNIVWMNAGVYTRPVPTERAVHNLEHGAVWITYRPDLPQDLVTSLRRFVDRQTMIPEPGRVAGQANRYIDLSPWASDALPAPIVISSWGYQLRLQTVDTARLQEFVDTFRHSRRYSPEFHEPVDGQPVSVGGRPAFDGSAKPNPA
ncbi:DUF3105 domain-containing protein [Curtobacterium ammoniigenes]|uniref:DUF3105 domain-containing protein n=1 Tax=Curtobacterium ammoniigenes TaxID=395387 RepID=UPI00146FD7A3|nr:DUF3105 domain-containing protein [Curtobacterium ammoniigenes]